MTSAYEYTSPRRYASKHQYADEEFAVTDVVAEFVGMDASANEAVDDILQMAKKKNIFFFNGHRGKTQSPFSLPVIQHLRRHVPLGADSRVLVVTGARGNRRLRRKCRISTGDGHSEIGHATRARSRTFYQHIFALDVPVCNARFTLFRMAEKIQKTY